MYTGISIVNIKLIINQIKLINPGSLHTGLNKKLYAKIK